MQKVELYLKPFNALANDPLLFNPRLENIIVIVNIKDQDEIPFNLTASESIQATKFYHKSDQLSYSWRHHLLNTWLSKYCNTPFDQLLINTTKEGKSSLSNLPFHFNISKSGHYLAFAFGPSSLGVDIEVIKDFKPFLPVADQHFHQEEKNLLAYDALSTTFFAIWTRKEALLKAVGSGINDELHLLNTLLKNQEIHSNNYQLDTFVTDEFIVSLANQNNETLPLKMCYYNIPSSLSL